MTYQEVKGYGSVISSVDDYNQGIIITYHSGRMYNRYNKFIKVAENEWNNIHTWATQNIRFFT